MNLVEVAEEIQHRIIHIFGRDAESKRALNGGNRKLDHDPHFRDYVLFYEASPQFSIIKPVMRCRHSSDVLMSTVLPC
jgi:hypothetical protein